MTALCFTDAPQIDELPECWTDEAIDLYLETEQTPCSHDEILTFYRWDDDILRLIPPA